MSLKKLKRVVIKEELVALTGKVDYAIVLNQFIYWSERVKDVEKYLEEEFERVRQFSDGSTENKEDMKESLSNGWIYKTANEMIDECMFEKSEATMTRIIKELVNKGWLNRRRNPKYKWDKTWQYRVNIIQIQKELNQLGYALEGYNLGDFSAETDEENEYATSNLQNESSMLQNASSNLHFENPSIQHATWNLQNESSMLQNERAIPEITTKTTTNITSDIKNKNNINEKNTKKENYIDLIKIFKKLGTPENSINEILQGLENEGLTDFDMEDVDNQLELMQGLFEYGGTFNGGGYAKYFVNGLKDRTEQRIGLNVSKSLKKQELKVKQAGRDLNIYYNWLEDK